MHYEPCGAAVVGGLYTLNSSEGGAGADTAVVGSLLGALSAASGAVDARVDAGLLGADIDQALIVCACVTDRCVNPTRRPECPSKLQCFSAMSALL